MSHFSLTSCRNRLSFGPHPSEREQTRTPSGRGAHWRAGAFATYGVAIAAFVAVMFTTPQRCLAEADDDTPSIVGYAFEGFGTGVATGFAAGYLSTGPKFEGREWRKLLLGGGIGALTGLGVGLVLGIVDASTVPDGPGVGFYMIRDSNYGYAVGGLAGGVIGALIWAGGGVAKDVLQGLAWGTVIGAGTGLILGVVEGSIRTPSRKRESASASGVRLGLGFAAESGGRLLPYPNLSGRF